MSPTPPPSDAVRAAMETIITWMTYTGLDTVRLTAMDAEINGQVVIVLAAAIGDKCDDLMARTDNLGRDGG